MPDFKVTRYRVHVGEERRGPESPFSVVLLTDLHNASYGDGNNILLQEIRNENPSAIFVAGDMLTSTREPQMDAAIALMDELTQKYPVYYANGNHESRLKQDPNRYGECYEKYTTAIRCFGVHLLENTSERIEIHRMPINVWGLELPREYFRRGGLKKPDAGKLEELLGMPIGTEFQLLLAHHPAYFDAYCEWGADLTLAGHLHGGIVRLPLVGGVISPQLRPFPRYDRGMFTKGKKKMIVSAGLGNHTVNLRINNPPELVVIDFV